LTKATRAPDSSARPTREAAGYTISDEPKTSIRSQQRAWCSDDTNSLYGSGSPKFTTDETSRLPQATQAGCPGTGFSVW
jgi:hypothetical protein